MKFNPPQEEEEASEPETLPWNNNLWYAHPNLRGKRDSNFFPFPQKYIKEVSNEQREKLANHCLSVNLKKSKICIKITA